MFCYSHVEGHSNVFGTGLNYTALRLLGVDKDHPVCVKARSKLHQLGTSPIICFPSSPLKYSPKVVAHQYHHGASFGCPF